MTGMALEGPPAGDVSVAAGPGPRARDIQPSWPGPDWPTRPGPGIWSAGAGTRQQGWPKRESRESLGAQNLNAESRGALQNPKSPNNCLNTMD